VALQPMLGQACMVDGCRQGVVTLARSGRRGGRPPAARRGARPAPALLAHRARDSIKIDFRPMHQIGCLVHSFSAASTVGVTGRRPGVVFGVFLLTIAT
jgi:hypothetical protein